MNHRQKIVQTQFLNNEEAVIRRLKQVYSVAQKDIEKKAQSLQDDINRLDTMAKLAVDADEKEKLLSMQQSKIYQKQYQDALKKQVGSVLDNMQVEEFKTVSEYLQKCYEDGFVGTMYDLQGQGIPMCFPLDQEQMVRAVQLDSKISQGLYIRLGEDVALLKKKITAQVSRGISTGMSFQQVAQQLAGYTNIGYNNAIRIARTEGHRIQVQSAMDACYKAKDKGADVVKQWDSTLDDRTRESHQAVDGEIRELDKPFSNGLMFPGDPSGKAEEVINCRCALLQRAKWALEGEFTKMNNFTKELETFESPKDYDEFKKGFFSDENVRYMNYVQQMEEKYGTKDFATVLDSMTEREYKHYSKLLERNPVFNARAAEEVKKEEVKKQFIPAKDMKEAKTRLSNALGIPEENINLGRMKPELANQYLEGVETFMDDFPMLKGYYGTLGTKTGSPSTYGLNKLKGEYETINGLNHVRYSAELHLRNPTDLSKMMDAYDWISESGSSYENNSPMSTAIHELVHGIDHAISLKKHGAYGKNGLGTCYSADHGLAIAGVSREVIKQARDEMFGKQFGKEVAEQTRYLGKYARTSTKEELAEAISYEYVNPSNPYSAKILELFKERVKGAFGE